VKFFPQIPANKYSMKIITSLRLKNGFCNHSEIIVSIFFNQFFIDEADRGGETKDIRRSNKLILSIIYRNFSKIYNCQKDTNDRLDKALE
jgi:hypothetical protein